MRSLAPTKLTELGFNPCKLLELYWLCCIFSDYDREWFTEPRRGFRFERLILPEWFPLPFGFRTEQEQPMLFKGRRILPCEVWTKHDLERQIQQEMRYCGGQQQVGLKGTVRLNPRRDAQRMVAETLADWAIVLAADHPIHRFVKKGRPITTTESGLTSVE